MKDFALLLLAVIGVMHGAKANAELAADVQPAVSIEGVADVNVGQDGVVSVNSTGSVSFVRLTWTEVLSPETLVLNDAWERSYGDLEWKNLFEMRISPWYYLANVSNRTWGVGVETGPGAMCCWEVTTNGTTLVLDLRAGGQPVKLGGRTLKACRIVRAESREGESAWDFGRRFCKLMCPNPKLPKAPVYGYNDWYCAYGKNTATNFLADATYIMECAKGCSNPPYVVMDDGWQRNAPPVVHESGRGPWDAAGPNFGMDMQTFCRKIAALGAKPGLWYRPLRAWDELPEDQRLKVDRNYLDPTVSAVKSRIIEDMLRFRDWGFKLVKIDFLSYDLAQIWPCDKLKYADRYIQDDRAWRDSSRTTAEVMLDLYRAMKNAAGDDVVIIGCNAFNHLAAGVFELQRTGNDTSGKDWSWTLKHGVNTLAMRGIQDCTFFAVDADCAGLAFAGAVPWRLNRQWIELLSRSGTPFFISWSRSLMDDDVRMSLKAAFAAASQSAPTARASDWMETPTPRLWSVGVYNWLSSSPAAEDLLSYCPTIRDRCWMLGHDSGQHDGPGNVFNIPPSAPITQAEGCLSMGISNVCVVIWNHPDEDYCRQFRSLKRVSWAADNGWLKQVKGMDVYSRQMPYIESRLETIPNLMGVDFDDFFYMEPRPKSVEQTLDDGSRAVIAAGPLTQKEVVAARRRIASWGRPRDMRIVVYSRDLGVPGIKPIVDVFDTVLFWTWDGCELARLPENFARYRRLFPDKPTILGIYMWDFGGRKPIGEKAMAGQLAFALEKLHTGELQGVMFHNTALANKDIAEVKMVRRWIAEHGKEVVGDTPPGGRGR